MKSANMWECECGHIEYGEFPPEECGKCWKLNCFIEVPEDLMEERKDRVLGDIKAEENEEELVESVEDIEHEIEDVKEKIRKIKTLKSKIKKKSNSKKVSRRKK